MDMSRLFTNFLMGFLIVVFTTTGAFAQQISHKKDKLGPNVKFYYSFKDYQGRKHDLSFLLPSNTIRTAHDDFQPYSNYQANTYIYNKILKFSRALTNGVQVDVRRSGNNLSISARGPSEEEVQDTLGRIRTLNRAAQQEYLHSNYFIEDPSQQFVFPDHITLAQKYIAPLRPVASAIRQKTGGYGLRATLNYTLNFLQGIPYDTLMSRESANGAGFTTPPALFDINKGDCDTKSVALASLVKTLYPRTRTMLIYTSGHAFIGFSIPAKSTDKTLNIEGTTFVLAEPAGPGVLPIGEISPTAEVELNKSRYSYREVS